VLVVVDLVGWKRRWLFFSSVLADQWVWELLR
jgi:hypothetical protein